MREIPYGDEALEIPPKAASWPLLLPGALPRSGASPLDLAFRSAAQWALGRLRGGGRLAIVVPDRTRPLPLVTWLPRLLELFGEAGVPARHPAIVPASGIHAPMSVEELSAWVGREVVDAGVRLLPHDADAPAARIGVTTSGIDVALHPTLADADALLAIGRLVFHYLAGYGGGRKMLAPGCASRPTILALHRRCLDEDPARGRHPLARAGVLEGNPVNEAACEVASLLPEARALHVALDAAGGCALARFGDLVRDHARAAEAYGAAQRVEVEEPLEEIIVSAGGHPVDRDLVQAHKALDAVAPILAPGARVLLVARCRDGAGNRETLDALRLGSSSGINDALRRDFRVGAHTALALREKTEKYRVSFLGELSDETLDLAGMERAASLEAWVVRGKAHARAAIAPRGASALYSLSSAGL